MKTAGEILKAARLASGMSLDKLSQLTKIDLRYVEAVENDKYDRLPSATFAKGFIRNIAKTLGRDPDEILAVFRRDYHSGEKQIKTTTPIRTKIKIGEIIATRWIAIAVGLVVFLGYLAFQYRAVITPPRIELTSPVADVVLVSPIAVDGFTDPGSVVTINSDLKITPDSEGHFATKLNLLPGNNEIKITSTSRFGRSSSKTVPIVVLSE